LNDEHEATIKLSVLVENSHVKLLTLILLSEKALGIVAFAGRGALFAEGVGVC
jgi:hypothetical protein